MDVAPIAFQFGGRLSLDLTWTLRFRAVRPTDLLVEPADLGRWLAAAGLPLPGIVQRRHLADFRSLREAIYAAAACLIDDHPIAEADRELINRWSSKPPPFPVLAADGLLATASAAGREAGAALSAVARDAIDLLAAATAAGGDKRLRRCSGPRCSLLFHDDSRPGSRRWCSTARCGNRVNLAAHRARLAAEPAA